MYALANMASLAVSPYHPCSHYSRYVAKMVQLERQIQLANKVWYSYYLQICAPTNTPATPPQFPDALAAFSKMTATDHNTKFNGDKYSGTSPATFFTTSPQQVSQSPKHIEVGK